MKSALIMLALVVSADTASAAQRRICADGVCFTLLRFERDVRDTARLMCQMEDTRGRKCPDAQDIADLRKLAVRHPRALSSRTRTIE